MAQFDGIDEDVAAILGLNAEALWPCASIEAPSPPSKSPSSAPLLAGLIVLTGVALAADNRPQPSGRFSAVDATAPRGGDHPPLAQSFFVPHQGSPQDVRPAQPASVADVAATPRVAPKGRRATPDAKAARLAALVGAHSRDAPTPTIDSERRSLSVSDVPTRDSDARDVVRKKLEPAVERVERLEAIDAIRQLRQK